MYLKFRVPAQAEMERLQSLGFRTEAAPLEEVIPAPDGYSVSGFYEDPRTRNIIRQIVIHGSGEHRTVGDVEYGWGNCFVMNDSGQTVDKIESVGNRPRDKK